MVVTPTATISSQQGQSHTRGSTDADGPSVYFSPRRSSAPDTPNGRLAEAAGAGAGAVAGVGAAWLWQGAPGQPLQSRWDFHISFGKKLLFMMGRNTVPFEAENQATTTDAARDCVLVAFCACNQIDLMSSQHCLRSWHASHSRMQQWVVLLLEPGVFVLCCATSIRTIRRELLWSGPCLCLQHSLPNSTL